MTAVAPAPHHSLQALREDWGDAVPLAMWEPMFGWDFEGEPPVTPKWRVRRWKMLAFLRGYKERLRALRALTTDAATNDAGKGTMWARSKWNRLHVIPSLLIGPVTFTEPDFNANADELAAYDDDGGSYSWSVTLLHATYGWAPLRRVYIYRESESTY
ncbi:hypothetical protein [Curtobacterium sp. MCSS17_016]|uniref:hypothetical protein n=1 Tax=Curtobacterium sp. MCSS17_016 TaxID=2175644 RepID=UPI000DA82C73|nr:hypothetical protein [Curtobacterium sp. MCSS17_016]WIE81040.1 hypothetical protein DEJ19_021220 [Curtobacterium sp. MCSS17_016]